MPEEPRKQDDRGTRNHQRCRATAVTAELERARDEFGRLRAAHAEELARLAAAHDALLSAERARAARADADLAALRAATA